MNMTMIVNNQKERARFLRFAMVGAFGAVVDFGTFNLLTTFLKFEAVPASVCSFIAAVISNFLWNRYWTYPDSRSKPVSRQLVQFTVVSLVGLIIRTPLFASLEKPLLGFFASLDLPQVAFVDAQFLGHNFALAIAVIVVMFWNFFINRFWTYNDIE